MFRTSQNIFDFLSSVQVLALVPDLITVVDLTTGEPISTDLVRYGLQVAVLQLPAAPQLCTEAAFAIVGPKAFGYDEVPGIHLPGYVMHSPVPSA